MKIGQFFKKMVGGSMILAALAAPVFTSCYDDSALIDRLDKVEQKLTDLETKLNTELAALKSLLEGQIAALQGEVDKLVTVTACTENTDGSFEITLSDGKSFVVYPEYEQDLTGLVTTTKIDGVVCWAVYEDGKPVVVTDADGKPVPVVSVVPQVRVDAETGVIELSFDEGKTWIEVGTDTYCVFSGAEVVYTDNYTDEEEATGYYEETPLYVTVTLPDGNTYTVTVDGASSFTFASNYGGPIKTQYISTGSTVSIPVVAANIVDWVKELPAGWQVKEDTQYLKEYGQAEFFVTAPSAEAIASGAAVAEGNIKVVAVAEGGKSVTASVFVTTKPFKSITAGKGSLNITMNNGLGGYLVGISTVDDFDPEAILAELKPVVEYVPDPYDWMDYGWSPWYVLENETPLDDNCFDSSLQDYPIADLASSVEMTPGEHYVVWVIGLESWMDDATWTSGYYLGDVESVKYLNANINLETTKLAFNDIQITADFKGVEAFYGQFSMLYSDELNKEGILAEFNSGLNSSWGPQPLMVSDVTTDGVYTGNPNDLVEGWQEIGPDEKYYLYLIPVEEGKTKYTMADVYFYEWATPALTAGGSLEVTPGEAVLEHKRITVPLNAEGAVYIYYKFVDPEMVSTIEDKAEYLLENGAVSKGSPANALQASLNPNQTKTLIAMAVDKDGKYGPVFQKDYTTKEMTYAEAVVKAELQGTPAQTGKVKISCEGADVVNYYYWVGSADDYQWTNPSYLGGSVETASAFIALTPNSYLLKKVAAADVPAEGVEITNLTVGSPSIFVVSAELADGFTKATMIEFTPAMDLGNFVFATDENGAENPVWAAAKPTVTYETENIGDATHVVWSVSVPEGYSAKTTCFHEDYLTDYPTAKSKVQYILTYPYIDVYDVVDGESYEQPWGTKGYNIYTIVYDAEGNYYETYVEELNLSGGFGV